MTTYERRAGSALDAAETIFAHEGYGSASMREVAAAAGLSVAGLYYYLPSKNQALFAICKRAFKALSNALDEALESSADAQTRLRAFVRGHVEFLSGHPQAYRVLLHDMAALQGPEREEIGGLRRRYFARANDLIVGVQQEHTSAISTHVATAALFGMMNWMPMWHREGDDADCARIAGEMSLLFLHGVAA